MLRNVDWWLPTDVTGHHIGHIFKGQAGLVIICRRFWTTLHFQGSSSLGNYLPTFRDNISVTFSRVKRSWIFNLRSTVRPFKIWPICCPETSVNICQSILPNISKQCRSHLRRGESLKSHVFGIVRKVMDQKMDHKAELWGYVRHS